jgi:hypothetical protein
MPELRPDAQLAFAVRLEQIDQLYLASALSSAVAQLQVADLDREFSKLLTNEKLVRLATCGLRAETFFPCPTILESQPYLLAYYRLLYGISQKTFYRQYGRFKAMEDKGVLTAKARAGLSEICSDLCETGGCCWRPTDRLGGTHSRPPTTHPRAAVAWRATE